MQSLSEKVLEEIGADKKLKMRLAELIISEPDARLFIIKIRLTHELHLPEIRIKYCYLIYTFNSEFLNFHSP